MLRAERATHAEPSIILINEAELQNLVGNGLES